jgi:ABC-type Zn uptake system ZnuABC Zn-binding protein ZnuA
MQGLRTIFLTLCCFWLVSSCGKNEEKPKPSPAVKKINVVTTVAPITSMVENIGGDKIRLTGIIPEGINSHTFEPVPSDVKILAEADLLIVNGLELEEPTLKLAKANMKQGSALLRLGDKTITEKEYIFDFSFPKSHGHPNPHLWLDPRHALSYATLIRDELARLDPDNKSAYEQNAAAYKKQLEALAGCSPIPTPGPTSRAAMAFRSSARFSRRISPNRARAK